MDGYAWGVRNKQENAEMMIDETTPANRRLDSGTKVVSTADGEPGYIVRVCTYRRNGSDAWSYLVETQYGNEVWEAGELFTPGQPN